MLSDTLTYVAGADWNYDLAGSTLSTPGDADVITRFTAVRDMNIPADFAGTEMTAGTAPGTIATLTVSVDDVDLTSGTITYDSSDVVTLGSVAETAVAAGSVIEITITTADGIDDVGITMKTTAGEPEAIPEP